MENMTKEEIKQREQNLTALTGKICDEKLNGEYFQLCKKLIKKMARKRSVPFVRGKLETWAAAVVYAIGSINFLFDKSFKPYMSAGQISEYFGTKNSTVSAKARKILDMFKIHRLNPEFSTSRMNEMNPYNNIVMVDGLIVPLESIPKDLQELVKRERAEGRDVQFKTDSDQPIDYSSCW